MLKTMLENIIDKITGGGNSVHETLDREIESNQGQSYEDFSFGRFSYGQGPNTAMERLRGEFTEPSRYQEILEGAFPEAIIGDSSIRSDARSEALRIDDMMRAILGNQYGGDLTYGDTHSDEMMGIMDLDRDYDWRRYGQTRGDIPLIPKDITDIVKALGNIADIKQYEEK